MKTTASQTNRPTTTPPNAPSTTPPTAPPFDPAVPVDPRNTHSRSSGGAPQEPGKKDEVDETSEESFPASDPPAWTPVSHS